jgi:hypothetical protein
MLRNVCIVTEAYKSNTQNVIIPENISPLKKFKKKIELFCSISFKFKALSCYTDTSNGHSSFPTGATDCIKLNAFVPLST